MEGREEGKREVRVVLFGSFHRGFYCLAQKVSSSWGSLQ